MKGDILWFLQDRKGEVNHVWLKLRYKTSLLVRLLILVRIGDLDVL